MTTKPFKITKVFCWVVIHQDGEDGIPAIDKGGMVMPLISSNRALLETYRHAVLETLKPGMSLEFRAFDRMRVIETIPAPRTGTA